MNLATHLLLDAFRKRCGTAVVMSNDSDLAEPIRITEDEVGIRVGIINPHPANRRSRALRATFFKQLRPATLAACQLPTVLHDDNGEIRKPAPWWARNAVRVIVWKGKLSEPTHVHTSQAPVPPGVCPFPGYMGLAGSSG